MLADIIKGDIVFIKSFCKVCGSALSFANQSGKLLIIPARSLDKAASIQPQSNIFHTKAATWLNAGLKAQEFDDFPE